ncbi:XdhC family protein [soil metagenome]
MTAAFGNALPAPRTEAAMPANPPPAPVLPDWPTFGLADDVRPELAAAIARGEACALVTLTRTEGGAPRPEGAQMLVGERGGALCGFLSGGCVEGDVALHAAETLADGEPRTLVYGEGSPWPDIRLLCGARIELLVERVAPDDAVARRLLELTAARREAFWLTDGRAHACASPDETRPPGAFAFARRYEPEPRLVVVGADPTALAIAGLGISLGFQTHLVRPRGPATPPPLPGAIYHRGDTRTALAEIGLDAWTHVAVATHDLEIDEAALLAALPSPAPYVGVLGARRRLPERRARLQAQGVDEAALQRLRGPIGLDLGGKAPFEIAVAVMAEITAARHAGAAPLLTRVDQEASGGGAQTSQQ